MSGGSSPSAAVASRCARRGDLADGEGLGVAAASGSFLPSTVEPGGSDGSAGSSGASSMMSVSGRGLRGLSSCPIPRRPLQQFVGVLVLGRRPRDLDRPPLAPEVFDGALECRDGVGLLVVL